MAGFKGPAPFEPAPANILSGGVALANSTTSTAFLTVPAGRMWRGSVSVCAQSADGTSGGTAGDARVVTAGDDAIPAEDTILAIVSSRRDTAATAVTTPEVYVVAPAGNAVTLNLENSVGSAFAGFASACGVLFVPPPTIS